MVVRTYLHICLLATYAWIEMQGLRENLDILLIRVAFATPRNLPYCFRCLYKDSWGWPQPHVKPYDVPKTQPPQTKRIAGTLTRNSKVLSHVTSTDLGILNPTCFLDSKKESLPKDFIFFPPGSVIILVS